MPMHIRVGNCAVPTSVQRNTEVDRRWPVAICKSCILGRIFPVHLHLLALNWLNLYTVDKASTNLMPSVQWKAIFGKRCGLWCHVESNQLADPLVASWIHGKKSMLAETDSARTNIIKQKLWAVSLARSSSPVCRPWPQAITMEKQSLSWKPLRKLIVSIAASFPSISIPRWWFSGPG